MISRTNKRRNKNRVHSVVSARTSFSRIRIRVGNGMQGRMYVLAMMIVTMINYIFIALCQCQICRQLSEKNASTSGKSMYESSMGGGACAMPPPLAHAISPAQTEATGNVMAEQEHQSKTSICHCAVRTLRVILATASAFRVHSTPTCVCETALALCQLDFSRHMFNLQQLKMNLIKILRDSRFPEFLLLLAARSLSSLCVRRTYEYHFVHTHHFFLSFRSLVRFFTFSQLQVRRIFMSETRTTLHDTNSMQCGAR